MNQGTLEWLTLRAGKFTGSRFANLMATTRSGLATSRSQLILTLALERLTGVPETTYQNDAMRRGHELEPLARNAYEILTGELVETVGFLHHPDLPYCGVSPDGLIGDNGLIEIKCPASQAKHLSYLRHGAHATEYRWQIQGQLWVTGRQWCDAVSYDPRFPAHLQLAITRVNRDESTITQLRDACIAAEAEVIALVDELQKLKEST